MQRDDSKALEYYRLSAAQGDVDAQAALKRLQNKSEKRAAKRAKETEAAHMTEQQKES